MKRLGLVLPLCLLLGAAACSDDTGGQGNGNGFTLGDELNLSVTPETVNFGAVALGEERSVEVELRHTGSSGVLLLLDVKLVSESGDLSLDAPEVTELQPGTMTTLKIRYNPSDGEHDEGTILVSTNVPKLGGGALTYEIPVLTLEQEASLLSEPFLHDFGPVESGSTALKTFVMRNIGELPFTISQLGLKEENADFKIVEAPDLPAEYGPGDDFELVMAYTPTDYDIDIDWLELRGESLSGDELFTVELRGVEVWGQLVVDPPVVDFGLQLPGQVHTLPVTLTNEGTTTLVIEETDVVDISLWSHTIGIVGVLGTQDAIELEPGETLEIEVAFLPDPYMEPSTAPVAEIIFTTNDPISQGTTTLPVFGKRRGAGLEVFPADMLSFGFVGEGGMVTRTVKLANSSLFPISVERVWLEGEFTFQDPDGWGPTQPAALAADIQSGETREITLIFENEGGDWTTSWGKIQIDSNDLLKPHWEVLLQARAASKSPCVLQLVPESYDLGFVVAGETKTTSALLVNIGGSTCGFNAARVDDCEGESECTAIVLDDEFDSTSQVYSLTGLPDVATDNLPPGEGLEVEVSFTAPNMDDAPPDEVRAFYAILSVRTATGADDGALAYSGVPDFATWGTAHNLKATVAQAQLVATPGMIDFEDIPVGCQSEPFIVQATNVGAAPIGITDWALIDCAPTFEIVDTPVLDDPTPYGDYVAKLYAGESSEFRVAYAPINEEVEFCTLAIYHTASDVPAVVELVGKGTYVTDHTDVFTDSATQDVDVLFIVDDSGSMSHEQQNLAKSFDAFIKKASEWQSDFQIGVVTTTVAFPDAGVLQGSPPFVTHNNWEKFIHNVQVGTSGSGHEQGLWAAKIALGAPTTDITDESCEQDSDCGFFHACMNGFCGGKNQYFIRESASLELVFLSDEEDQSPESTDEYLKYFKAIKGFDQPDQLHIHAIVGPAGGCSTGMGSAVAGHPYLELAEATGGVTYSICEADFGKGLESIGEVAFSAKMRYFLSKLPAPTTIEVTIDGYPCPPLTLGAFNWTYNPENNSVQLTEESICKAEPGSVVEIYYKLLCFAQ